MKMKFICMSILFVFFTNTVFASFPFGNDSKINKGNYNIMVQKGLLNNKANNYSLTSKKSWILGYSYGLKYDYTNNLFLKKPKIGKHSYYAGYRFNYVATGLIVNGGLGLFLRAYFFNGFDYLDDFYINVEATHSPDVLFGMHTNSAIYGLGYEFELTDFLNISPRISYYRIKDHIFVDDPDPNVICLFCTDEIILNGIFSNLGLQLNLGKKRLYY